MGGKDKLKAITTVYMQGTSEMNGNEITNTSYKVQDKLYRNVIDFGRGSITTVITPDKGWRSNPRNGGAFEPLSTEDMAQYMPMMDCAGPLIDYATKGHKAELVGKDTVDGVACYKIKLTTKWNKEISYWIDASTNLMLQVSQKASMGGRGEVELSTKYKDYKAVDGIQFPYTNELKGGFGGGTMYYEKIELNKPVDEKLYKAE
jgi:outer membrane lipoprotein-sorting protein